MTLVVSLLAPILWPWWVKVILKSLVVFQKILDNWLVLLMLWHLLPHIYHPTPYCLEINTLLYLMDIMLLLLDAKEFNFNHSYPWTMSSMFPNLLIILSQHILISGLVTLEMGFCTRKQYLHRLVILFYLGAACVLVPL